MLILVDISANVLANILEDVLANILRGKISNQKKMIGQERKYVLPSPGPDHRVTITEGAAEKVWGVLLITMLRMKKRLHRVDEPQTTTSTGGEE